MTLATAEITAVLELYPYVATSKRLTVIAGMAHGAGCLSDNV